MTRAGVAKFGSGKIGSDHATFGPTTRELGDPGAVRFMALRRDDEVAIDATEPVEDSLHGIIDRETTKGVSLQSEPNLGETTLSAVKSSTHS